MKIGVLTDKFHAGSTPKVIGEEVRYLREFGHDAEAISIMEGLPEGDQYQDYLKGLPIRFLSPEFHPVFKKLSFKFPLFAFFSSFHILSPFFSTRVIHNQEYDVIISHGTYTCFTAKWLWKKKNIPYLAFIWDPISYILPKCYSDSPLRYGFPVLLPLGLKLDSYLIEDALAVIVCSHFHVNFLRTLTDRPIEVVYPGCEPIKKLPPKRGEYILAVDRWDIGNTPNKLLGMMRVLPRKAKLLVVGFWHPPRLRYLFEKDVKTQGLEEQVKVMGPANRKMLKKLYSEARVLVHPNEEVFGFVPHEAAACGCPIIMPATSGNTEIYKHGVHGFFPSKFDVGEYAKYVEKLIEDERLAWKMGYEAWKISKNYTWKRHTLSLEKIIAKYVS